MVADAIASSGGGRGGRAGMKFRSGQDKGFHLAVRARVAAYFKSRRP